MTTTASLNTGRPGQKLRTLLMADAVLCGAMGALLIGLAGTLDGTLGISESFLRWTGVALVPWAALILIVATRPNISRSGVLAIAGGNVGWTAASALLLLTGTLSPTTIGTLFVIAQALIVLAIADLQFLAQRRSARLA